jgi:lipopolysaccharide transport system permease protein
MRAAHVASSPSAQHAQASIPDEVIIKADRGWVALNISEVWAYRELLFFFTWRDIKVRYKQTLLGAVWIVLQPVSNMLLFSIIFGNLAHLNSEGIPYPLFSFSALLPWTFFQSGLSGSANSLVGNANLIEKVYFPRLVMPLSSIVGRLPDFLLSFLILIGLMVYYGIYPTNLAVLLLPVFLLLAGITALGVGLWFSAITVLYRDARIVVGFLTRFWMYASPVVYSASIIKQPWTTIYALNPMSGVITGFRWALLGQGTSPDVRVLAISSFMAVMVLVSGAFFFRRMERIFADLV